MAGRAARRWSLQSSARNPYAKLNNPQSLNLYAYAGNNPESVFDPDGHQQQNKAQGTNTVEAEQCDQYHCSWKKVNVQTEHKAQPQNSPIKQEIKGGLKMVLGIGLIATVATGDVPGGAVGALLVGSAGVGGAATTVSGTADVLGGATHTDVKEGEEALDAAGNLPGLAVSAGTLGNMNAGRIVATVSDVATTAANPREAMRNVAMMAEAARTAVGAARLAHSQWSNFKNAVSFAVQLVLHQPFL